ncbi:MAG: two-component system, NtrC family, nitrogen regulation sensor histidine kinase NtrY [Candidatus Cloacimonadota bacterium]|jgi:nitrogen fixation/metabolism regulation signal transduction histidine kinase|nr:two-component system, NtrC family, nitrogen regulation sensor histidine kinase NtrY [Candidatus Cloacimonadota bacterium]
MKFKMSYRSSTIVLFLVLIISSLLLFNSFFNSQLQRINTSFKNIEIDRAISNLSFKTEADQKQAAKLLYDFRESLATTEMIQKEAKVYSGFYLLLILLVSSLLFILSFYKITKPLKELQIATRQIKEGNFQIQLPETGFTEIRELKHSFNSMSQELQATQSKLIEAEKDMIWKEFSRMLAHEIKNPLTPIQLSVQRLEDKYLTDRKKFEQIFPDAIKIVNQEVNNLYNLAKSISNFAKNISPEYKVFKPYEVIKDIISPYSHKYNIILEGCRNCQVKFDQIHFYQIVTNILQNAIDASSPADDINLNLVKDNNKLVLQIIDSGKGIAPAELKKIFEPYYSKKRKGIGLGLAFVKKLVEVNNANLKVESQLGIGTKFEVIMEMV